MPVCHVNVWAVAAAAAAAFALGGLWYSPLLFAHAWVKSHGFSEAQVAAMQKSAPRAYAISFAGQLVMAAVLAYLISATGIATAVHGALLGAIAWLGFAATIGLMATIFSGKAITTYLIDAGYQLVYLVIMGAILGAWH